LNQVTNFLQALAGSVLVGEEMPRGGVRSGAGRPKGQGRYQGEATRPVRLPVALIPAVQAFVAEGARTQGAAFPLYACRVAAGFPSPADDYLEGTLNLHDLLVRNPPATFFVRASGDSMTGAGIFSGDLLVVDRSEPPLHGRIVIAIVDGELTVKRLYQKHGTTRLDAENPSYPPILFRDGQELRIWGVVTNVIRSVLG
jgi:DNA polymerase V